jgi:hypothetical protein
MEIAELKDTQSQTFRLRRCKAGKQGAESELVEMKRGIVSVAVSPRELVCLRSVGPRETGVKAPR